MAGRAWLVLVVAACGPPAGTPDGGGVGADGGDVVPPVPDGGAPVTLPAFCTDYPPADLARRAQSAHVWYGDDGLLQYAADADGNRVPDFGAAGYHAGEDPLPDVPEVARIGPGDGDDTARIQAAIDDVEAGALVLEPGTYEIRGTLRVRRSGVVLRGSGDETILRATGDSPHQRSVIVLGAGGFDWRDEVDGTRTDITTPRVRVGERAFDVAEPERLSVGDRVVVHHPSTSEWIAALDGGGATVDWQPGQLDIAYLRRIEAIDGATVTLDAPVYTHLDVSLATSSVYAIDDAGLVREAGVEALQIEIETAGGEDEDHAWNGVDVAGAEDSWVRGVTVLHFGYAAVKVRDANRITVSETRALEPVAQVTGGRLYHFAADGFAQQVVFADCEAELARHGFVSNGTSTVSGVVFLRGRSVHSRGTSEGHRRWSQGLLYDRIVETVPTAGLVVGLYNRGDWGTQHGWASVHSVIWRHDTGGKRAVVQRPPTAQNYAIGTIGDVTSDGPFDGPPGAVESIAGELAPASLYEAQVCDRLRR